jgi:hypothetical protein
MSNETMRWLLDIGLPRTGHGAIDAVQVEDRFRVPGPAGIREAIAMDRALVTCNQDFRGASELRISHPGIVILEEFPLDGPAIERNLLHLEFRLSQHLEGLTLPSSRFLLKADREVLRILEDGSEVDIAPWREVWVQRPVQPVLNPAT